MRATRIQKLSAVGVLLAALAVPGELSAGCINDYLYCSRCADRIVDEYGWAGVITGIVTQIECDIDLFQCVALGDHNRITCPV